MCVWIDEFNATYERKLAWRSTTRTLFMENLAHCDDHVNQVHRPNMIGHPSSSPSVIDRTCDIDTSRFIVDIKGH